MVSLHSRLDWELQYALSDRDQSVHYPWWRSLGAAWRLIGWVLQQPGEHALKQRFVGSLGFDTDTVDLVVAALGLAILEEAAARDTVPGKVPLVGIAAQLTDLAAHRQVQPLDGGVPDDLWPQLSGAEPAQLDAAAELAGLVLLAHVSDAASHPIIVADRLRHCPQLPASQMLLDAVTRRQLDLYIRPRVARRIGTPGSFLLEDDRLLTCPGCGMAHGLQLSTQDTGSDVTASCPNGHTWLVPELTPEHIEQVIEDEGQRRSSGAGPGCAES